MADWTTPRIFDGHNDLLLRLIRHQVSAEEVAAGLDSGHICLPRAKKGGLGGGFFAIFAPSGEGRTDDMVMTMENPPYDLPLPEPLERAGAWDVVQAGFDALDALEQAGAVTICRSAAEVETALGGETMAAVIHIEGAEAISESCVELEELYARGLRSLGPVWSRPTVFAEGVPFAYPSSPDRGAGLTEAGERLVAECGRLGIMIDLSHLNEKGFDDVARLSDKPLVATHSNAHAVTPHARNLTDRQLKQMAETGGMVGINYACAFLREDGAMRTEGAGEMIMRHLDHLIGIMGEDGVGFGSDFDGALVPEEMGDAAGLLWLREALAKHGVDAPLMEKLAQKNWLRVMRATWGG